MLCWELEGEASSVQGTLCRWVHALSMLCLQLERQGEQRAEHSVQVKAHAEHAVVPVGGARRAAC
jgi:hypothetical protein